MAGRRVPSTSRGSCDERTSVPVEGLLRRTHKLPGRGAPRRNYSSVPIPAVTASTDPAVIARGEYLAHAVAHCSLCHTTEAVTKARVAGDRPAMVGGYEWVMGPLGTLHSRNITPDMKTGIGTWTDGELARAIKWGVGRDHKLLVFMNMSVPPMADEDVVAIVSYLRSTPPVVRENKPHDAGVILHWLATLVGPGYREPFLEGLTYAAAEEEPTLARGEYLANGPAFCFGCHTPFDMMSMSENGPRFSGTSEAEPDGEDPSMVFRQPNLTPDPETGHITSWDEETFVARLRAGRILKSSKMPWEAYRDMTDVDLRSIYRYLRSLPPTKHYIGPTHRKGDDDPSKDPGAPKET